jgi:O-antigen/teichoic acid export membrane protein
MLAITPALLARHHFVAPRWDAGQIRALAAIGLPVAVASFLGVIYFRVLVVMMSLLSDSAREVGYYVTSSRVIETVTGLPVLLITVVVPVLTVAARDNVDRVGYMTARMTEAMLLAGVLIALVLALAARPIVLAMAGQEYEPAVEVLQIQCIALVTIFAIASWNPALIGTGRVRELAWATGVGVVAMLVLGVVLIPPLDATGAAIAAVAADLILCVATYVAVRRAGPGRALDHARLAKILLAGGAAAAVGLLPGVPDVVLAVVGVAVFSALVLVMRLVPPEIAAAGRRLRSGA